MANYLIGWDIGGAHVKVAVLNEQGDIVQILQKACPLWKGVSYLQQAVSVCLRQFPAGEYQHYLTMTGELADCFQSREQGVASIISVMRQLLADAPLEIFSRLGFLAAAAVKPEHSLEIASLNWLSSACLAAQLVKNGLFIDTGSTTTDILRIVDHKLQVQGFTDYQRLLSGELVYTGVVRTPVMAIAQRAEFNGRDMGLMAEYFATAADVYRVTGELNEAHDQTDAADGAEKTASASARRLSRMTGYEYAQADWSLWLDFARHLKQRQQQLMINACQQLLTETHETEYLVGAGVGRFLLKEIAQTLGLTYRDFNELFNLADAEASGLDAGDCAPAVAVAYLGGM